MLATLSERRSEKALIVYWFKRFKGYEKKTYKKHFILLRKKSNEKYFIPFIMILVEKYKFFILNIIVNILNFMISIPKVMFLKNDL